MGNYLKLQNNSGLSLIATVLALLLFSLFIAVAVSLVTTGSNIGLQEEQGVQALFIAEGGLEWGLRKLSEGTKCDNTAPNSLDDISTPPISLGIGNFTLSGTEYKPAPKAQLTANIGSGATSITVNSTVGYAPSGRITIQTPPNPAEAIDYTSISSGNTFMDCLRGVDGTTASAHNINDRVVQNQCDIISTGTISSNPLASVRRQVTLSVQQ